MMTYRFPCLQQLLLKLHAELLSLSSMSTHAEIASNVFTKSPQVILVNT